MLSLNLLKVSLATFYVFSTPFFEIVAADEQTKWGEWSQYGPCSKTCGTGHRIKTRRCEVLPDDLPEEEGDDCVEDDTQDYKVNCRLPPCKIDGGWGSWSTEWSECESTNCTSEKGYQYKFRSCNDPIPKNGGSMCQGSLVIFKECVEPTNCPVDGGWTKWTDYECSIDDNEYVARRSRNCSNPVPKFGGANCDVKGLGEETTYRNDKREEYDTKLCAAFVMKYPPKKQRIVTTTELVTEEIEYDYEQAATDQPV